MDRRRSLLNQFDTDRKRLEQYVATLSYDSFRRLLDETLVIATGEMGRTPKANAESGRDHWSTLFSTVIAGAGMPGERVYGRSNKDAAYPADAAVSPANLAATVFHALGIDHELRVPNAENRPMPIVDGGYPLMDLWS